MQIGLTKVDDVESTKLIDSLKMSLRTQPMSFVLRFIEIGGLDCLLNFLKSMSYEMSNRPIHTSMLGCLKALMNSTVSDRHLFSLCSVENIVLAFWSLTLR